MRVVPAVLLVAIVAAAPGDARAFVPEPDAEQALVLAEGAPARRARTVEHVRGGGGVPAGWRAIRDRETGVVLRLWGGRVDAPGAVRDPAAAERAARAFLAAHLELLAPGSRIDDLALEANRLDGRVRTVLFRQTWRGLRVVGGYVHVAFAGDRLFVAGSEALPHVRPGPAAAARAGAAQAQAEAWLGRETGRARIVARPTGERVVLPIVRGRGAIDYRIADVLDARGADAAGRWDVYVDPGGAPIARASRVRFATGTLRYDVVERHPGGARIARAAANADLTVDGAAATTDAGGGFAWAGGAPAAVAPSAAGTFVRVTNGAGPAATAQLTAQPDQPLVWSLAADEHGDAQLVAYVYGTIAKAYGRRMQPDLAWLDQQLELGVNLAGECNAFSTGDSIHFYRGSAACENTARLADVVVHELGHSYHFQSSIFPMGVIEPALAEGLADFFTAHLTGDPGVGRGFRFTDEPVRQLDPPGHERVYPTDALGGVHQAGRIIGGALWDLRRGLYARLPADEARRVIEQIFVGVLRRASDLPSSYVAALTADDDDGDLGNGTPHGCEIELAFGRHGLAGPEFRTTSFRAPVTDGLAVSVAVDVPAGTACPPPQVTSLTLAWRTGDGTPAELAMAQDGATWRAELPPQPDGTVVSYQIAARLDDGQLSLLPDNPADPWYQLLAGEAVPIWCERFDADPGWTLIGHDEWAWGPPGGEGGDPDAAFTGEAVLGTTLGFDGTYRNMAMTAIRTPRIDASRYERVHLQLRRWLTVEDAAYDRAAISVGGALVWANASGDGGTLDHVDKEWRFVDLDVTPHRSDAMTVTWLLSSDVSRRRGGWNIDDVCLVGFGELPRCAPACEDEAAGCCGAGAGRGPAGPLALAIGAGLALFARRRRRRVTWINRKRGRDHGSESHRPGER